MPRSDEAEWWFNAVYEAVKEIPHGKVTSYGDYSLHSPLNNVDSEIYSGHIARLLGKRPGGAARQAAALRQERVTVDEGSLGELSIDFTIYGWFPRRLPSEGTGENGSDDD
ncbi:MAG: hypothetical protein Q9195_004555 [Heterodermia aff. obscurata]